VVSRRRDGHEEVLLHRSMAVFKGDVIEIRSARSVVILPLLGLTLAALLIWMMVNPTLLPFWAKAATLLFLLALVPICVMALVNAVAGAEVVIDARKGSATWQQGYLGMGIGTRELVPFAKIGHLSVTVDGADPDRWHSHADDLRQFALLLHKKSGKVLTLVQVPAPAYGQEDGMDRTLAVGQAIAALVDTHLELPEGWELVTIDTETRQRVDTPGESTATPRPAPPRRRKRSGRRR
jgi:hypothetical protein